MEEDRVEYMRLEDPLGSSRRGVGWKTTKPLVCGVSRNRHVPAGVVRVGVFGTVYYVRVSASCVGGPGADAAFLAWP